MDFNKKNTRFQILSDEQIEKIHYATLKILERTGVSFDSQKAIDILSKTDADVSNPDRVKIPSYMVDEALRTTPKSVTLYTRDGDVAMDLDGTTGSHFGAFADCPDYLDPREQRRRKCYVEDIKDNVRVIDALPNLEWLYISGAHPTLPGSLASKVSLLQILLNSVKPIGGQITGGPSDLKEFLKVCSKVAGGKEELKAKPFFISTSEPTSPLSQSKDAMNNSLLCAEKGIPNVVYAMPMAGATAPASLPATIAMANAEFLSQLVVIQQQSPGAPIVCGGIPGIIDMRTAIYSYGAPEMSLMVGADAEISHSYDIPFFGTAGATDAKTVGTQASAEAQQQVLTSLLTEAEFVHDVGLMDHGEMVSPEMAVLTNELIDMGRILKEGIEINEETLPLDLIEKIGPSETFLHERHTRERAPEFWRSEIFDYSREKTENRKDSEELLNERTLKIMEEHEPKPLPEELIKELKDIEKNWFENEDIKHEYPKRE